MDIGESTPNLLLEDTLGGPKVCLLNRCAVNSAGVRFLYLPLREFHFGYYHLSLVWRIVREAYNRSNGSVAESGLLRNLGKVVCEIISSTRGSNPLTSALVNCPSGL